MKITRVSMASGVTRTLDLPITREQLDAWRAGALAQKAFPNLSPSEREFIISGITDEEWERLFGDEVNLAEAEEE